MGVAVIVPLAGASLAEIESVYRVAFPRFVGIAAAITGDVDAGAECVQEAFARAVRRRATYRRQGPLEAWIWRMVVRAATDYRSPHPPVEGLPAEGATTTTHDSLLFESPALAAIHRLPE